MAILPLCYQTRFNVVSSARVDDDLFDLLRTRTWFISSRVKRATPRFSVTLRCDDGTTMLTHFFLSRVVQGLVMCTPEDQLILMSDAGKLWEYITELPRIKFLNGDPMDCRAANLSITYLQDSIRRRGQGNYPVLPPAPSELAASQALPPPEVIEAAFPSDLTIVPATQDYAKLIHRDTSERDTQDFLDLLGQPGNVPQGPGLNIHELQGSVPSAIPETELGEPSAEETEPMEEEQPEIYGTEEPD